jgi:hypothetical protein
VKERERAVKRVGDELTRSTDGTMCTGSHEAGGTGVAVDRLRSKRKTQWSECLCYLESSERGCEAGGEGMEGEGTEGEWYASWSCSGRDGRYGEAEEQEKGSFMEDRAETLSTTSDPRLRARRWARRVCKEEG